MNHGGAGLGPPLEPELPGSWQPGPGPCCAGPLHQALFTRGVGNLLPCLECMGRGVPLTGASELSPCLFLCKEAKNGLIIFFLRVGRKKKNRKEYATGSSAACRAPNICHLGLLRKSLLTRRLERVKSPPSREVRTYAAQAGRPSGRRGFRPWRRRSAPTRLDGTKRSHHVLRGCGFNGTLCIASVQHHWKTA